MDDLNLFRIFVAAAESGSFTTAAAALGLTRSAVAKAVARLEARTGTRLFQRTTRVVALTEEGRALHARCTQTIADLQAALDDLAGWQREPRGVLRLALPDAYGRGRVMPVLARFLAAWPRLQADVSFSDRSVDLVAEGYDLAVRIGMGNAGDDLIAKVIARHRVNFFASPDYLARHGEPETIDDLRHHARLCFVQRGQAQTWRFRGGDGQTQGVDGHGRIRFDNGEALCEAALYGLGIAQLPDFLIERHVAQGRLRRILEAFEPEPVSVHALYPSRRFLGAKVRLFLEALRSVSLPSGDSRAAVVGSAGVAGP